MPVMNNKLPTVQGRVSQRPRVVRSVRVHAASPVEEPDKPQGLQAYFTDGLRSVFQVQCPLSSFCMYMKLLRMILLFLALFRTVRYPLYKKLLGTFASIPDPQILS